MKITDIITWLRFPLSVCIILRHLTNGMGASVNVIDERILNAIQFSFSSFAVPVFFVISGYLFFFNIESFDRNVYMHKLKRRVRSLLIPYLFWNTFYFTIYFISYKIRGGNFCVDFNISGYITGMWACPGVTTPIYFVFWFIRDLMIMCIFTPLFYLGIKKIGIGFVLFVFIIYLFTWDNYSFKISPTAPICFILGSYLAINKIKYMPTNKLFQIVYLLFTVLLLTTDFLHQYMSVLGLWSMFIVAQHLSKRLRIPAFFSNNSFPILSMHIFYLTICYMILLNIFNVNNSFIGFSVILLSLLSTILLCCLTSSIVKKISPSLSTIIFGGH